MNLEPIEWEAYEIHHQAAWVHKEIELKHSGAHEYEIKNAKLTHFRGDLHTKWRKLEAKKASRRRAIDRLLTEIEYMIDKRCAMIRNTPNRILCSEETTKRYIIEKWSKELGE